MKAANDDHAPLPTYSVGTDARPVLDHVRRIHLELETLPPPRDRWWHIALAWALCIAIGAMAGAMI